MDDLNPKARALIDAGRAALRASAGDRDRIEAALRARLGADALPVDASVPPGRPALGRRLGARLALGTGALAVGVAFLVLRPAAPHEAHPAPAPVAAPTVLAAHDAPAELPKPAAATAPVTEAPAAPAVAGKSSVHHGPDPLAQEVKLLSRATAELRAGRADKALKTLDQHQRRFPSGALLEERRTARAQALCMLGRTTEGRRELSLLPPHSPGAARAEQACDAASATTVPR